MVSLKTQDARRLSPKAQEAIRQRATLAVVEGGMSQKEAAQIFGVSRQSVNAWVRRYREQGMEGLLSRPRGRPSRIRLEPYQAATVVRIIESKCPDEVGLPYALWTREAVQELIKRQFGIQVSLWTVGRYLRRWGFTPQKPVSRAYEQDPKAVQRWLTEWYPAIHAQAQREGAEIHWGDEMGIRSDHQAGRTWGRRGQTPVVPRTGHRFSCNVLFTLTNKGSLAFMATKEYFNASLFLKFLWRLLRHSSRKVFLIVDRHPVHRSGKVRRWLGKHQDRIHMFLLPAYSPELNPGELINQDVKTNAVGRRRPRNSEELLANVRGYMRSTQRVPSLVRRYFQEPHVRYAA